MASHFRRNRERASSSCLSKQYSSLPLLGVGDDFSRFSGKITYTVDFPKAVGEVLLSIEDASEVVTVSVNGHCVGTRISTPYTFELTDLLQETNNSIQIEVINNLGRSMRDYLSQFVLFEPLGITGEIKLLLMRSKMNNQQLAADILKEIGGKANIESVTHCVTRLRFVLHDTDIPNKETIASLDGVISVVEQGGQYQIVLGNRVNDVYDTVLQQVGELKEDNTREKQKVSFDQFTTTISGIFTPALGAMAASGTIKGILTILSVAGILSETSGTYIVLYALSNAFFYFMPILLGASAANYFKLNSYVGMLIGASLIYPTLLPYATEGSLTFCRFP